jgi:broad specificity phosphatase PhoE
MRTTSCSVGNVGVTSLLLVRHGESTANVAASAAEAERAEVIDAPLRDADVPLSQVGVEQASAVGAWLRALPDDQVPHSVWASPYLRAADTARLAIESQRTPLPLLTDERLRDRELGVLDTLTTVGVETRLPLEAARKRRLGKYYYRPPGGESWVDVALRLRFLLADLDRVEDGRRLLVFTHDAVIVLLRSVCQGLSEADTLALGRSTPLRNASISRLVRPGGSGPWTVDVYNSVDHLRDLGAPVTAHPGDRDVYPR